MPVQNSRTQERFRISSSELQVSSHWFAHPACTRVRPYRAFWYLYPMRAVLYCIGLICFVFGTFSLSQQRAKLKLPHPDGSTITIDADRLFRESENRWVAEGNVVVSYQDTVLKTSRLTYNSITDEAVAEGNVDLTRGTQWLKGTRGEFNLKKDTGTLYDAEGFTDEQFYLRAEKLTKTGADSYVARNGFLTSCEEETPKWSFTVTEAQIKLRATARLKHTLFRIKNIPVFYLPYTVLPTSRKDRSSGFLLPSTGTSNNKGRRLSQSFYLVLGRSSDFMVHGDYFSQRGYGYGFNFRARPNTVSRLSFDGYVVNDRKDQGGVAVNGVGETRFANGFRAVADFNLVSNFVFRRVFSDNFYTATRPTKTSRLFLTNNFQTGSVNFSLSREETAFPGPNVVIRSTPAFDFKLTGHRLFQTPFYLDLNSSAEGLSRADRFIETPGIIQRLDLFPKIYFSLPLFQGLRLNPRIGFRETFYSDSLRRGDDSLSGDNVLRQYFEFGFDLKGWGLSKVYGPSSAPAWKHLIEPVVSYRHVTGIEDFDRIIRFDERDAIANTQEVEYALVNRIFVKRENASGRFNHEWLSFKIGQKHFLDPDFGGAFQPDRVNQFYPLNTLTGFPYGGLLRNFSPVTGLLRLTPKPGFSFDARGDFDPEFRRFRNFSVSGFLIRPRFSAGATYFVMEKLEPGTFQSQQVNARIAIGNLRRGLSASTQFTYDAEAVSFLNSRSRVNYLWDCCGVSLEYQQFNLRSREEQQFRFSFFLKGIGAFGTIKRPRTIFRQRAF